MSAKALADLFITLRSLYTILLVFSLTGALLPLKGKKLKPLVWICVAASLFSMAIITLLYRFSNDNYTFLSWFYFPFLILVSGTILLVFFHDNIFYSLFALVLSTTAYMAVNFPTEALRLAFSDPLQANLAYLISRFILLGLIFPVFLYVLRPRLLKAEQTLTKQFLYPFILSALVLVLLVFIGIVPKIWYERDSSIYYLIGYIIVFVIAFYIVIYHFILVLLEKNEREKAEQALASKIDQLESKIHQDEESQAEMARYRHDMRHHADAVIGMLQKGESQAALTYLNQFRSETVFPSPVYHSGSYALDSILGMWAKKAELAGVKYDAQVVLPKALPLSENDIIALFANLLENALNAASTSEASVPFIRLNGFPVKTFFRLVITNSSKPVEFRDGLPLGKNGTFGIGTNSVEKILSKHQGFVNFSYQKGIFMVEAAIPFEN